jgi:sporulation protein YlmC with PRC-barrel domain
MKNLRNIRQRLLSQRLRQRKYEHPVTEPEQPAQLPRTSRTIIRIEDLIGSKIVTAEGKKLGRVVDIHVTREREPEVIALVYGHLAWLYRLGVLYPFSQVFHLKFHPYIVPWSAVEKFERLTVTLKPEFEEDEEKSQ